MAAAVVERIIGGYAQSSVPLVTMMDMLLLPEASAMCEPPIEWSCDRTRRKLTEIPLLAKSNKLGSARARDDHNAARRDATQHCCGGAACRRAVRGERLLPTPGLRPAASAVHPARVRGAAAVREPRLAG